MNDSVLCVDIGTSSLKAALIGSPSSKSTADKEHSPSAVLFYSRRILSKADIKHAALEWIPALADAVKDFSSAPSAVCISGNGPTIVAPTGETLLWNTKAPHSEALKSTHSLFIPRLALFKNIFSDAWNSSAHIFSGPEFLIHFLTGAAVTILPESRYTQAYWTEDELKRCGFSSAEINKLPPFVPPSYCAGTITKEAATLTGIAEETPVFCGGPDFISALIGTNTLHAGALCDRAGSSEGLNLCTATAVSSDKTRTLPSVQSGLWTCDYLIPDSGARLAKNHSVMTELAQETAFGIRMLCSLAKDAGSQLPSFVTITGGQAKNETLVQLKADACGIPFCITECTDAELAGDNVLARVGLGEYKTITEAAAKLVKITRTFTPSGAYPYNSVSNDIHAREPRT
jgi:xylulokinase